MFEARRQEELKQLREEQRLHEVAKAGLGEAVEGKQSLVAGLVAVVVVIDFYRTHVHMGSDHWVVLSFSMRLFETL